MTIALGNVGYFPSTTFTLRTSQPGESSNVYAATYIRPTKMTVPIQGSPTSGLIYPDPRLIPRT